MTKSLPATGRRQRATGSVSVSRTVVSALAIVLLSLITTVAFPSRNTPAGAAPASPQENGRFRIPSTTKQLVVGIADSWSDSRVTLRRYTRTATMGWVLQQEGALADETGAIPGRLGPKGLAWGRGIHTSAGAETAAPSDASAADVQRVKREGDKRAPAGAFYIGPLFSFESKWSSRTKLPFVEVNERDLFVEDPSSEWYNRYLRLDNPPKTKWERSQQMEQNDPAHRLKILIEHNTNPAPISGGGSAIFFHVWRRGGADTTTGCTAMSDAAIEQLLQWLDPTKKPVYVLLPRAEYTARQTAWGLPALPVLAAGVKASPKVG
jgi:L,D-peptidoglycan transpeptidase YkuD (ErfK/YbiS/YcfS/YnhG family)